MKHLYLVVVDLYNTKTKMYIYVDTIFSTITSLYDLGLEDYARDFAFELNLGLIN